MISSILLIGGPESGKSNYLFRCWLAIERGRGALRKRGLPDDLEYLNAGSSALLEGRFAPHTSRDVSATCRMPVIAKGLEQSGDLVIPDSSGELWLDLYQKRAWPIAWDEFLSATSGFLLFVRAHCPHDMRALDWLTCERYYKDPERRESQAQTPTQVLLVEWLQILRRELDRRVGASIRPRLSVVVSAWDIVRGEEAASPARYLNALFPLFSDFLESRAHRFDARLFGVSVASGDLKNDETFRGSYVAGDPAAQGYSVWRGRRGRLKREDVLSPVYWALNLPE